MTGKRPPRDQHHAIQLYLSGHSCQDAARYAHISEQRLRKILKAEGLWRTPAERKALAAAKISAAGRMQLAIPDAEIVIRYVGGESENSIAKSLGVSRNVIRARLESEGVEVRSMSESAKLVAAKRSPAERMANVAAAHAATRGSTRSIESLCAAAVSREQRGNFDSEYERILFGLLSERGLDCIAQKAIGPYNCDIAAGPVAVDVHGGKWHGYGRHALRAAKRYRYFLDRGWNLVIVWIYDPSEPPGIAAADYITRFVEQSGADPSMRREHRVIWGNGQALPASELDIDDIARVPPRN